MANENKNHNILRQHSLNCEASLLQQRRRTLRKQFSEDIPDNEQKHPTNLRISLSAKIRSRNVKDEVPPVKIAWAEEIPILEQTYKPIEALVTTKCKETRRPLSKQYSFEKDSILYQRTQLTDHLRQAWKNRENTKQNLDIFLTHATKGRNAEEEGVRSTEPSDSKHKTKIILPLTPEPLEDNLKNIFQKYNKRLPRQHTTINCPIGSLRTIERPSTLVVVPIIVPNEEKTENIDRPAEKDPEPPKRPSRTDSPKPINVIIRPSTAAAKRQSFQKRTNSAFNGSAHFRPPLVRASSLPVKADQPKPKFVATKRHLRSAKKKDGKKLSSLNVSDSEHSENKPKSKPIEIVTMVSLVSPSGSDTEEAQEEKKNSNERSPKKVNEIKREEATNEKRSVSLRKTIKSVSFQQSSIHAVRSFSASFPARRASVTTAMMLRNSISSQKMHEKRGTTDNVLEGDETVAKRRLVRIFSAESSDRFKTTHDAEINRSSEKKVTLNSQKHDSAEGKIIPTTKTKATDLASISGNCEDKLESPDESESKHEEAQSDSNQKFESQNTRQCWELYKKMSEKGVVVSFDTILRGMLTPTEYRLHRSRSDTIQDNC